MKRTAILSLSLFVLANTLVVNSAQAYSWKQVNTGLKLVVGTAFSALAIGSGILSRNIHKSPRAFSPGPIDVNLIGDLTSSQFSLIAITSGIIGAIAYYSAYSDIKK